MVVLRSRVVDSNSKTQENPVEPEPEPKPECVDAETGAEDPVSPPAPARRRSLRLASRVDAAETPGAGAGSSGGQRKRKNNGSVEGEKDGKSGNGNCDDKEKGKLVEFDLNVSYGGVSGGSSGGSGGAVDGVEERGGKRRVYTREEKGKGKVADFDLNLDLSAVNVDSESMMNKEDELNAQIDVVRDRIQNLVKELGDLGNGSGGVKVKGKGKGKGKVVELGGNGAFEAELAKKINNVLSSADLLINSKPKVSRRMERFHEIARENASRFAHFAAPENENDTPPVEADGDTPMEDKDKEVEDWPGPYSTALKIIKDREKKMNAPTTFLSSGKEEVIPLTWVPQGQGQKSLKRVAPSLKETCLEIIAKNADYLVSLQHVPDALRHTLSQRLCDSRMMNGHSFDLLLGGCPTEVRVKDCSWMTEEQFTESFQKCDTSNLTVLQLDQCGRFMPDYIVMDTLARAPNSLPALTTLSLIGACRLSDAGLKALVSSAPRLSSINLNLCSLLTSSSIDVLADSLGSTLRELHISDCPSIDSMHILPTLKKLQHLEVLALGGMPSVTDKFMRELIMERGENMKELVLADCGKLTDSSIKVIASKCVALSALDLGNLHKLTDSAMGHLANGCRAIQTLRLSHNNFSDEAIAAFLESSGEFLRVLSLNGVRKVGYNTALSIARRSRNLISLDLSWCRRLTDECLGLVVDSCLSLKTLKLFGCTQITGVFLNGYSNPEVRIIGVNMSPILQDLKVPVI